MLGGVKAFGKSLLSFCYPPLCLHCRGLLKPEDTSLCDVCQLLLELIDHKKRCSWCFLNEPPLGGPLCGACLKGRSQITAFAAAFDYEGPAATIIQKLKYGGLPHLASVSAAYLAVQLFSLSWPLPDIIVPAPVFFLRRLERGYNQSFELSQALSQIIKKPVWDIIKKRGGYSQAALSRQLRLELNPKDFLLKKDVNLKNKTILLIDDVMTTGSTLSCCAQVMQEHYPKSIYALTFCRAIN